MGCGESKHAVATTDSISTSGRLSSKNSKRIHNGELPKDPKVSTIDNIRKVVPNNVSNPTQENVIPNDDLSKDSKVSTIDNITKVVPNNVNNSTQENVIPNGELPKESKVSTIDNITKVVPINVTTTTQENVIPNGELPKHPKASPIDSITKVVLNNVNNTIQENVIPNDELPRDSKASPIDNITEVVPNNVNKPTQESGIPNNTGSNIKTSNDENIIKPLVIEENEKEGKDEKLSIESHDNHLPIKHPDFVSPSHEKITEPIIKEDEKSNNLPNEIKVSNPFINEGIQNEVKMVEPLLVEEEQNNKEMSPEFVNSHFLATDTIVEGQSTPQENIVDDGNKELSLGFPNSHLSTMENVEDQSVKEDVIKSINSVNEVIKSTNEEVKEKNETNNAQISSEANEVQEDEVQLKLVTTPKDE